MDNEFLYVSVVPDVLAPYKLEALFWSNADGWVALDSREVSVFSAQEITHLRPPINPPYGVRAVPVSYAPLLENEARFLYTIGLN